MNIYTKHSQQFFVIGMCIAHLLGVAGFAPSCTSHCAAEQELQEGTVDPQPIGAALQAAIKHENREEGNEQLEALLEHNITKLPPKQREPLLDECLKCAVLAQQNHEDAYAMELLLAAKADPNALTSSQANQPSCSALHWAIYACNAQAVQLFLDHSGDPLVTNDVGISGLESYSDKDTHLLLVQNILQRLKAGKLAPNYCDPHTHQPLLSMVLSVSPCFLPHIVPLVKELLARGANPNTPNTKGDLPLHTVLKQRRDTAALAKVHAPEEKEQKECYSALRELEKMLCEYGAQEYVAPTSNRWCLTQ